MFGEMLCVCCGPSLKTGYEMCWKHRCDALADCASNGMNWQWAG